MEKVTLQNLFSVYSCHFLCSGRYKLFIKIDQVDFVFGIHRRHKRNTEWRINEGTALQPL